MEYGRETVTIFEIDQPLCSLTYGTAPCAAVLGTTGERKCFNTRATCQDAANYTPATLTLRFARQQQGIEQYGPLIPSLIDLDTAPAAINLAGMDHNMSALGTREVITVNFDDHQHSDNIVDPYRLERVSGEAQAD